MLRKVAVMGLLVMAVGMNVRAALPETPRLRQITVGDGLPSNVVEALAEDRGGHLWIGTRDGLARYDGMAFRIWRREDGLPANEVADLHVDREDRVWVATTNGLAMLDGGRGGFRHYNTGTVPALGSNIIWSVAGTSNGDIWFGTATAGLYRIRPDGRVQRFMPDPADPRSLPSAAVPLLETGPDGTLWIGTRGGVVRWTGRDFQPISGLPADPVVLGLAPAADGRLWIGLPQGLGVAGRDGVFSTALPWDEGDGTGRIYNLLLRDRGGRYWFDARRGLAMGGGGGRGLEPVRTYSDLRQGPVTPAWSRAHEDREGGLWLGSRDAGLWYLPPAWRRFAVLVHDPDHPGTPANVDVTAIAPSASGAMWLVGNSGVLELMDPDTGLVRQVYRDAGDYVPSGVMEDDAGNVWICFLGGLGRYDAAGRTMQMWSAEGGPQPAPGGECAALVQDADGLVWTVSHYHGAQARDPDGRLRESVRRGDGRGLEPEMRVEEAARGPDGRLWVSGEAGLLAWNPAARAFEPVAGAPRDALGAFTVDAAAQRVWLTRPGQLESYLWDGFRLRLETRLGPGHGMPLVPFMGLAVDDGGVVWLTSTRGLVRADPGTRMVNVFGVSLGLPAQEIATRPVPRAGDGRIHFATAAGLVSFDPAGVRPDGERPELFFSSVEVRGRDGARQLDPARMAPLGHRDHELAVRVRLAGSGFARNNRYRFRLHGYEREWVETGAAGERILPALSPGRYRLEAMGRTPLGDWSMPAGLEFEVVAPWWRTGGAWAAYTVLGLAVAGWILHGLRARVRRRIAWQRVRHEREVARQASDAKSRFLATLGHEVRTPMTGVMGMTELLLRTRLDPAQRNCAESIQAAGGHLMRLLDDALDLARIEAGKLEYDPQPFELRPVVEDVSKLMAPLARQRGLDFRTGLDAGLPAAVRGDAVRIRQILLNLVGNAIKFTASGWVELRVQRQQPPVIRFTVTDTGPGLDPEQKARLFRRFEQAEGARTVARYGGSGLGLAVCQELANGMGGKVAVHSEPGQGASFVVELPLPEARLPAEAASATAPAPPAGLPVLLVEDDPIAARVIAGLLGEQGCVPTSVGHGLAALVELEQGDFGLVVLDLDLPGIDGLGLARQLRARGWPGPLVAITARSDPEAEPLAAEAGFDAFLRKPFDGAALARAISGALGRRGECGSPGH